MALMIATGAGFSTTRTIAQVRENSSITQEQTLRDLVDQVENKSQEGIGGKQFRSLTNQQVSGDVRVNVVV